MLQKLKKGIGYGGEGGYIASKNMENIWKIIYDKEREVQDERGFSVH